MNSRESTIAPQVQHLFLMITENDIGDAFNNDSV